MIMGRKFFACWYGVDIQVEDIRCQEVQFKDTGLFIGFTPRYTGNIHVAIGMSARLQPTIELAVMDQ